MSFNYIGCFLGIAMAVFVFLGSTMRVRSWGALIMRAGLFFAALWAASLLVYGELYIRTPVRQVPVMVPGPCPGDGGSQNSLPRARANSRLERGII
jgi:hypothetical protein